MVRSQTANYGKGFVTIDDTAGSFVDVDLTAELERALEADDWLPPVLPRVALEILELSQKATATVDDVLHLLEDDALIAARVLRIAQSPVYSGGHALTSMRQALVRLGLNGVRDIVLQVSLQSKIFRHPTFGTVLDNIWHHCRHVAHLARLVSGETPFQTELSFISGLLHDVGIAGTLLLAADKGIDEGVPLPAIMGAAQSLHEKAGAKLATSWGFPAEVAFAIRSHHALYDGGVENPHAAILIVAESLDTKHCKSEASTHPSVVFAATQVLGFSETDVVRLAGRAEELIENLEA